MSYDYMGRRIEKKVYAYAGLIGFLQLQSHRRYVYDGYKLVEELDALNNNAVIRRYTWQPNDLSLDVPLSIYDATLDKTYYYHTDANKNVTELTDAEGNIVAHYEYSPFGQITKQSGAYAEANPFRFSSEYCDKETGLVYYNYRYYDPELGRWLNRDPIREMGGFNLYSFSQNNSIIHFDRRGLHCKDCLAFLERCLDDADKKLKSCMADVGDKVDEYARKIWDQFKDEISLLEEKVNADIQQMYRECNALFSGSLERVACEIAAWTTAQAVLRALQAAVAAKQAAYAAAIAGYQTGLVMACGIVYDRDEAKCNQKYFSCLKGHGKDSKGCPCTNQ